MGAAEIDDVAVNSSHIVISLNKGGAMNGSLYIYLPDGIASCSAENADIESVSTNGNIIKITLANRSRNYGQKVVIAFK